MMTTQAPAWGFLFVLLVVAAVLVALLLHGRWRTALLAGIGVLFVAGYLVTTVRMETHERMRAEFQATVAIEQAGLGQVQVRPSSGRAVIFEPGGAADAGRSLEVPDDVAAWTRDSALPFEKGAAWREEDIRTMERRMLVVHGTRFTYWEPSSNGRLVGLSGKEPTRDMALEAARESARRKLAALALIRIKADNSRFDALAAESLARRLAGKSGIWAERDVYQEFATRPYGTLHRAAVCIKAEEEQIGQLQTAIVREVASGALRREAEFRSWIVFTGAALLGGVVIFLIYTIANAGTKGYFAWPLRGAALGFFAAMLFVLFHLRHGGGVGRHEASHPMVLPPPVQAPAAR